MVKMTEPFSAESPFRTTDFLVSIYPQPAYPEGGWRKQRISLAESEQALNRRQRAGPRCENRFRAQLDIPNPCRLRRCVRPLDTAEFAGRSKFRRVGRGPRFPGIFLPLPSGSPEGFPLHTLFRSCLRRPCRGALGAGQAAARDKRSKSI